MLIIPAQTIARGWREIDAEERRAARQRRVGGPAGAEEKSERPRRERVRRGGARFGARAADERCLAAHATAAALAVRRRCSRPLFLVPIDAIHLKV